MRDWSLVPGVTTLRAPPRTAGPRSCTRLVRAEPCAQPPDRWTKPQRPRGGGASTDPALARCARTRSSMHMITYTHVRPDTRAAYNSQGIRKETVGRKGEEMK